MSYLNCWRQQERQPDSLKAQSERFVAPTMDAEHHTVTPVNQWQTLVRKETINTFSFVFLLTCTMKANEKERVKTQVQACFMIMFPGRIGIY